MSAWFRELKARLALQTPKPRNALLARVRDSLRRAPVEKLISSAASGQLPPAMKSIVKRLEPDDVIG
jgi:hypothetical protein